MPFFHSFLSHTVKPYSLWYQFMKLQGRIFICYRRDGGSEMARLVRDSLRDRGFDVFMDVEDLKSGQFNEALLQEIETATDVVAILSPGSLDRCFEEGDWLRWEVAHAIACEKNILPLRTRGFEWPSKPLPDDLKKLPYYQGVEPSHSLFNASMDKLVALLEAQPALSRRRPPRQFVALILIATALFIGWFVGRQHPPQLMNDQENVREKPDRNGWIPLFDGQTLSGWTAPDPGNWTIVDHVLIGRGKMSHLFSPFIYTNFEFKAEVKLSHGGNSGMYFRAALGRGNPRGYEAQIDNSSSGRDVQRTGSLYNFHAVREQLVPDDTWWTHQIIAIGDRIIIKVNDKIVTDFVDSQNTYVSGYLALQQYEYRELVGSVVMFRNAMAKRLPTDERKAWDMAKRDVPEIRLPSAP